MLMPRYRHAISSANPRSMTQPTKAVNSRKSFISDRFLQLQQGPDPAPQVVQPPGTGNQIAGGVRSPPQLLHAAGGTVLRTGTGALAAWSAVLSARAAE